ncbi:OLC1v1004900C2 [Oldenlandia corymbosa var. corymbosa]|uniref:OLC1v1004900C2 n=2 Tax=Oldenlandia corymbosa var. corymbosa TaxID=529605 RepID=A0AAV1DFE9_OLDCO|nr:OLC1v1004900C2 [Oldenlandia corymbosa var. corymbosa]
MLGISYGELFLIIGATAVLIGPKDLPIIARIAGRLAGRAIGYVQVARGQFDNVMQQTQARQVHKELQDTIAQLEAIRHEIRTISFINPSPLTRRFADSVETLPNNVEIKPDNSGKESILGIPKAKDNGSPTLDPSDIHSQATAYAKLTESASLSTSSANNEILSELTDESGLTILPVSAESAGLLPRRKDHIAGSDIVLEAMLEAEVAHNARDFFSRPENLMKPE